MRSHRSVPLDTLSATMCEFQRPAWSAGLKGSHSSIPWPPAFSTTSPPFFAMSDHSSAMLEPSRWASRDRIVLFQYATTQGRVFACRSDLKNAYCLLVDPQPPT